MKKARIVKANKKEESKVLDETYSIKKLLTIIFVLIIVFVVFYFITTLVVKPISQDKESNNVSEINSKMITMNHLLDRSEEEYFVIAIKQSLYNGILSQANYIEIYNKYISDYTAKEESLPFYNINLDDAINKSYMNDSLNISNNLEELKINNEVLFKIKGGKIDNYYVGNQEIIDALSAL